MEVLIEAFELPGLPTPLPKRWNIAPTQPVLAVEEGPQGRTAEFRPWGLEVGKHPLINVRDETFLSRPLFSRMARCLLPATGFYEWRPVGRDRRQPYYFTTSDRRPFGLGAIRGRDGGCAILTTEPNELVSPIHDRMPFIVPVDHYRAWLAGEPAEGLLKPLPAAAMRSWAVSACVNSPKHDGPECLDPPAEEELTLF
jgi:putative SOS response-associated peptidase YedK